MGLESWEKSNYIIIVWKQYQSILGIHHAFNLKRIGNKERKIDFMKDQG